MYSLSSYDATCCAACAPRFDLMLPEFERPAPAAPQPQLIGLGSGDEGVGRIQLAARWAEAFAPSSGDTLVAALQRFRQAFDYLDAVTHGVEPPALSLPTSSEAPGRPVGTLLLRSSRK